MRILHLLFPLCVFIALLTACIYEPQQTKDRFAEADKAELKRVAAKLGVKEDWQAVKHYVHCKVFAIGRLREDAERDLKEIDQYRKLDYGGSKGIRGIEYGFYSSSLQQYVHQVYVEFNSSDHAFKVTEWVTVDIDRIEQTPAHCSATPRP